MKAKGFVSFTVLSVFIFCGRAFAEGFLPTLPAEHVVCASRIIFSATLERIELEKFRVKSWWGKNAASPSLDQTLDAFFPSIASMKVLKGESDDLVLLFKDQAAPVIFYGKTFSNTLKAGERYVFAITDFDMWTRSGVSHFSPVSVSSLSDNEVADLVRSCEKDQAK